MTEAKKIILEKIVDFSSIKQGTISCWKQEIPLQQGCFSDEELEYLMGDTRLLKEEVYNFLTVVEGDIPTVKLVSRNRELILTIGGNLSRWKWR